MAYSAYPMASGIIMTQPLRRAHGWIMIVLAVVLPAVFVAGLTARKAPAPVNPGIHWNSVERP